MAQASVNRRTRGMDTVDWIANLAGVQESVELGATRIATVADGLLLDHHVEFIAHIEVESHDVDRFVCLVDSNVTNEESATNNSALSIELGRAGYIDEHGQTYGEMEGLYILSTAARVPRKRGRIAKIYRPRNQQRRGRSGRFASKFIASKDG